jgi:hypothetical protein
MAFDILYVLFPLWLTLVIVGLSLGGNYDRSAGSVAFDVINYGVFQDVNVVRLCVMHRLVLF